MAKAKAKKELETVTSEELDVVVEPAGEAMDDEPSQPEKATINIQFPDRCSRTNLSIDALDSHSRNLAAKTFLSVDGKLLLCRAIKFVTQGGEDCVQITVRPESFEVVG